MSAICQNAASNLRRRRLTLVPYCSRYRLDPRQRTPMDMSFLACARRWKGPPPMIQAQHQRQKPMVAHQTTLVNPKKQERQEQQQLNQRMPVQPQSLQQQIANRKKPVNKKMRTETKKQNANNLATKNKRLHEFEHELALVTKSPESNAPTPPSLEAQSTSSSPDKKVDSTNSRPLHPEMEKKEARKHLVDAMNRRLGMNMSNLGTYIF